MSKKMRHSDENQNNDKRWTIEPSQQFASQHKYTKKTKFSITIERLIGLLNSFTFLCTFLVARDVHVFPLITDNDNGDDNASYLLISQISGLHNSIVN